MYQKDRIERTKMPNEEQIKMVQQAVNEYKNDHDGILPIKNKDAETDSYIKYPIDFKRLVPKYLAEIPVNAFENGGYYQYVIINPEKNPTVKVFDLRIAETIRDIQFRLSTQKYPPYKERIANNVFTLDFKKLGYKETPTVTSPFSKRELPLVITGDGSIYVDYREDLYQKLKELKGESINIDEDIRYILTKDSPFVPAYSLPYTVDEKGDPIFKNK